MDPVIPPALDAAALARRLRETEAELERVTLRLRRLENATSVRLALTLARAARRPRAAVARLRQTADGGRRGVPRATTAPTRTTPAAGGTPSAAPRPAPVREAAGDPLAERLLGASAVLVATRDWPVLAVVADAGARAAWSDAAHVQPLRPDDASAVFAVLTPDVLVVDAAAARLGPWSGLGSYAVPDRDRTLLDLLHAARDRGVPAVLVPPDTPEEAPMFADAHQLFAGTVAGGATVADVVAAAVPTAAAHAAAVPAAQEPA